MAQRRQGRQGSCRRQVDRAQLGEPSGETGPVVAVVVYGMI